MAASLRRPGKRPREDSEPPEAGAEPAPRWSPGSASSRDDSDRPFSPSMALADGVKRLCVSQSPAERRLLHGECRGPAASAG
jgi:hypothetical protein